MLETLERLILDPITEPPPYGVAANRPIEITGNRTPSPEGHGVFLKEHSYPRPEMTSTFAGSRDSQGEQRFGKPKLSNRKIPIKVFVTEASGVGPVINQATNPAGELVKKFTSGADFVVTKELTGTNGVQSLSGEFRDKHAYDGAGASKSLGIVKVKFPKAGTHTVSVFVYIPSSWDGGAPQLFAVGGEFVGSSGESRKAPDLAIRDAWQRISVTLTVVAGDLEGFFSFEAITMPSGVGTGIVYSDALQVEEGLVPTSFLCGDTPGCFWTGKPNESTSQRIGDGRDKKRFIRSLYDLQEKIEKFAEEGGTYKRVLPDGSYMVFDVAEASFVGNWEKQFNQGQVEFAFELTCKPGARLAPITLTTQEEKTLPILTFTETDIPGNMSALGDLLIEDIQGVDRKYVSVAMASRFLDVSANAEVFYQAENRLRLSGAGLAAGSGTPSGAEANKVVTCTLFGEYTSYLSTRSSGGTYTSHVGAQKMVARVWLPSANKGKVSIRTEYSQGDLLRWRSLEPVVFNAGDLEAQWVLIDLGVVRLNRAVVGTQRWEGRISAKSSSVGDLLHIDWIGIMPTEEFYGEVFGLSIPPATGTIVAYDDFSQGEGALAGKTAVAGGNWSGAGDADDFSVTGAPTFNARRQYTAFDVSAASNSLPGLNIGSRTGRYERLGTGKLASVSVETATTVPTLNGLFSYYTERRAVFARYLSSTEMLMGALDSDLDEVPTRKHFLRVGWGSGGGWTPLASKEINVTPGAAVVLSMYCGADGAGYLKLSSSSGTQIDIVTWSVQAVLATAGALNEGGYGLYHEIGSYPGAIWTAALAPYFDNFAAREMPALVNDAAVYANRDLRIRWDKTVREASDGSGAFDDVGLYKGDRLYIPPSGRENRPARISVLASRNAPKTGEDIQADDIKAILTITPRVIEVPEPV